MIDLFARARIVEWRTLKTSGVGHALVARVYELGAETERLCPPAAVVWAPRIAFGEGESREMHDARLEREMRAAIENELRWRWQNARALEAWQKFRGSDA